MQPRLEEDAKPRGRGSIVAAVAVAAALISLGGLLGATLIKSPQERRAETQPPGRTVLTSPVERRVLASTVVTRGVVGAAREIEVTPATAQGAAVTVVTGINVKAGDEIEQGKVILTVSGRPLVTLAGAVPVYRDLRPGDSGQDVAQLQRDLQNLSHYHGGDRSGFFGAATKAAVRRFYGVIGFSPPDTGGPGGKGDRAALRSAADAVAAAQANVDSLKRKMKQSPLPPVAPGEPTLAEQLRTAEKALQRAKTDQADLIASTGTMVPMAEIAFVPGYPARIVKLNARIGSAVTAPLVTIASGRLDVTVKLRPDQAGLVSAGMTVALLSETLAKSASGKVSAIGALVSPAADASGQGGSPYIPVTVAVDDEMSGDWNGQDVRVTITAAQTAGEVLVVPVTAVSAGADGKTTVTVAADGGVRHQVEVRVGVNGDGFVEITPVAGDLGPGDRVVVGQ